VRQFGSLLQGGRAHVGGGSGGVSDQAPLALTGLTRLTGRQNISHPQSAGSSLDAH
jgi:hypothetical protein